MRLACLLLLASPALAHAESGVDTAFGVNAPFRWVGGDSVGASGYLALSEHHALRANVATYTYEGNPLLIVSAIAGGEDEASYDGRITDAGFAWTVFSDKFCSGLTFETGMLVRRRDVSVDDGFAQHERVETATTTLAGRALLGWTFRYGDIAFASLAVGVSVGYERGSETFTDELPMPGTETHDVSRRDVSVEGLLRIGAMWDR